MKVFLTIILLTAYCLPLTATIRYVSHEGSNTPPYLTWETAADSIMSAINISVFGDTIYVANGIYEEQVIMIPGLTLIGAGMDSCVIDTRGLVKPIGFAAVTVEDSSVFKGFQVIVANSRTRIAIKSDTANAVIEANKLKNALWGILSRLSNSLVINNIFQNFEKGISITNSESLIINNQFINVKRGVEIDAFNGNYYPVVEKNVISCDGFGVIVEFNSRPTIRNNIIFLNGDGADGYQGGGSDTAWVYNNLVISEGNYNFTEGLNNTIVPTIEFNNFLIGNFTDAGINVENFNIIKNNNIMNSPRGIIQDPGDSPIIQYNNSWNNTINYGGFTPDSTNLSVDPMVVSEDSLDFHLQMFSPLIDAGDPDILDIDETRSDIGLHGGLFGERYEYIDLAPKPPRNLSAIIDSNFIALTWNPNTESDFNSYNIFRDTTANFTADSTTFVIGLIDTFYLHIIPPGIDAFYYKLTATDNQGNESQPSEELAVIITSVNEYPAAVSNYQLYQNYPNPFNPSTKIAYKLEERGYVKLYVYDIKGELIDVLVNQVQDAGYYEVEFGRGLIHQAQSTAKQLASGIYIYQIMIKSENSIPVFTDMKKMLMIK
ncbi:MAG: right-handed parallel beta-helix repeat-containing protein [Bacteroidetes bacterium]|nr:right-handed parallel beta-helix repeat-containing protein [Bacteroidota bacterium]